jgi:hypothetical protein
MILASLAQALSKLDPLNDNHWTQDGLPRLDTLKMLTGDQTITRDSITSQFPEYKRVGAGQVVLDPVVITAPVITPPVVHIDTSKVAESEVGDSLEIVAEPSDLEKEQAYLAELERDYHDAKASYEAQLAVVDTLILDAQNDLTPAGDTQLAIREYLNRQQMVLKERQAKIQLINESGIDLKKLAVDLVAPIDRPKPKRR